MDSEALGLGIGFSAISTNALGIVLQETGMVGRRWILGLLVLVSVAGYAATAWLLIPVLLVRIIVVVMLSLLGAPLFLWVVTHKKDDENRWLHRLRNSILWGIAAAFLTAVLLPPVFHVATLPVVTVLALGVGALVGLERWKRQSNQ